MARYIVNPPPPPRLVGAPVKRSDKTERVTSRLEAAATLVTQANRIQKGRPIPAWANKVEWTK